MRFSKSTLQSYIQGRINTIQAEWGFDPSNGTAQIASVSLDRFTRNPVPSMPLLLATYSSEEARIAYGEFNALLRLAEEYDLEMRLIPEGYERVCIPNGFFRYLPAKVSP